jgi:hypothetical protein
VRQLALFAFPDGDSMRPRRREHRRLRLVARTTGRRGQVSYHRGVMTRWVRFGLALLLSLMVFVTGAAWVAPP